VGTAYTEVPGAKNKEEFFAALRSGMGQVAGESGSFTKLTRDVFLIAFEMMCEKSWTALLAPLAVLVPAITLLNYYDERAFLRRWAPQVLNHPETRSKRRRWLTAPQTAVEELV
jgi:hypothetical protein